MITKKEAKEWFNNFNKDNMGRKDERLATYNHFLHYGIEKGYVEHEINKKLEEIIDN
jgi:hypothetical protein